MLLTEFERFSFVMNTYDYPNAYLYRRILKAKMYIEESYAEPIDINRIAEAGFFSKYHFIRVFKKIYGKTPYQYLTFMRIEKAKLMQQSWAFFYQSITSLRLPGFELSF